MMDSVIVIELVDFSSVGPTDFLPAKLFNEDFMSKSENFIEKTVEVTDVTSCDDLDHFTLRGWRRVYDRDIPQSQV
ncbi:hypothetical protein ACFQI3_03335 [Hansschlegelia quercus]|uniref:hypothetical protein n=1 Tax=Hansschlegelia quercus TaxID=2528245 RepID=UPI001FDFD00D|nr:hypothetical protein [Hansschlegelia quercus]